jgi:predicted helicase
MKCRNASHDSLNPMTTSNLTKFAKNLGCLAIELKKRIEEDLSHNTVIQKLLDDYKEVTSPNTSYVLSIEDLAQSATYNLLRLSLCNVLSVEHIKNSKSQDFFTVLLKELHQFNLLDTLINFLEQGCLKDILQETNSLLEPEEFLDSFYLPFISTFTPTDKRESIGLFYTPKTVTSFITRSVDLILRDRDNFSSFSEGLASRDKTGNPLVKIIDPAVGTGNFLLHAINQIEQVIKSQPNCDWNNYVLNKLLPSIYGFEISLPVYALAHLCLSIKLFQSGYKFTGNEQIKIFLTDSLSSSEENNGISPDNIFVSEFKEANKIKSHSKIPVIVCNPPFNVTDSRRKTYEIANTLKGSKYLTDSYIQFLYTSQDFIGRAGYGVIGTITNNEYISSPTFAKMRQNWLTSFSDIYIINLRGNQRTKESPLGEKDENIFDVRVGLGLAFLIKRREPTKCARVHYAEVWGTKQDKNQYLSERDIKSVEWKELKPFEPSFFFNWLSLPLPIDLRENGLHSLQKGIKSYQEFHRTYDYWLLKESVMFLNHGIELLMKQILVQKNENLIFTDLNTFAKHKLGIQKNKGSTHTVTFTDAMNRVSAFIDPPELDEILKSNLTQLNDLRNQIEHHKINLDGQTLTQIIETIRDPLYKLLDSQGIKAEFLSNEINEM